VNRIQRPLAGDKGIRVFRFLISHVPSSADFLQFDLVFPDSKSPIDISTILKPG
jgi:hypothetical protein